MSEGKLFLRLFLIQQHTNALGNYDAKCGKLTAGSMQNLGLTPWSQNLIRFKINYFFLPALIQMWTAKITEKFADVSVGGKDNLCKECSQLQ